MRRIDLVGKVFERLTVIGLSSEKRGKELLWDCVCSCGNRLVVAGSDLRKGHTKSCGCFNAERRIKHGVTARSPRLYNVVNAHWLWCTNPKLKQYKDYGGCGWHFAAEWLLPDGKPNYPVIESFLLDNGWDDSDSSCIFEKDKLSYELAVKEIGPRTVRVIHKQEDNQSYMKNSVMVCGTPLPVIVRMCGIPTTQNGKATRIYSRIYDYLHRNGGVVRLFEILKDVGVSPTDMDKVHYFLCKEGKL